MTNGVHKAFYSRKSISNSVLNISDLKGSVANGRGKSALLWAFTMCYGDNLMGFMLYFRLLN